MIEKEAYTIKEEATKITEEASMITEEAFQMPKQATQTALKLHAGAEEIFMIVVEEVTETA